MTRPLNEGPVVQQDRTRITADPAGRQWRGESSTVIKRGVLGSNWG